MGECGFEGMIELFVTHAALDYEPTLRFGCESLARLLDFMMPVPPRPCCVAASSNRGGGGAPLPWWGEEGFRRDAVLVLARDHTHVSGTNARRCVPCPDRPSRLSAAISDDEKIKVAGPPSYNLFPVVFLVHTVVLRY